jgi:hypothetical protein
MYGVGRLYATFGKGSYNPIVMGKMKKLHSEQTSETPIFFNSQHESNSNV